MSKKYDDLKARDQRAVFNTYGRYPLAIASGRGCRLHDLDGKEYVDLLAGIAVSTLGHAHPELAEVMARQASILTHVSNLYLTEPQVELAERLTATFGDKAFFCNSGAEANEAAIKLARRYMRTVAKREAFEIITVSGSFHGRTLATLTATGQSFVKDGFDPLPQGFVTVPLDDAEALEAAVGPQTAAVMIEVVQGEGGVNPLTHGYLAAVADTCKKHGLLCIVDEVQTGLCRTGAFWAFEHVADTGLRPDIVTLAKPLAGGLPMGAMLATDEAAKGFVPGSHATTFGGGPLVAAVACKVLEIMERDGLAQRAAEVGAKALEIFRGVQARHPDKITDVRGLGLMLGIELRNDPDLGKRVFSALTEAGFLVNLSKGHILRLLPPLIIELSDLEAFAHALDNILTRI